MDKRVRLCIILFMSVLVLCIFATYYSLKISEIVPVRLIYAGYHAPCLGALY